MFDILSSQIKKSDPDLGKNDAGEIKQLSFWANI